MKTTFEQLLQLMTANSNRSGHFCEVFCLVSTGLRKGSRLVVFRGAVLRDGGGTPSFLRRKTHRHVREDSGWQSEYTSQVAVL